MGNDRRARDLALRTAVSFLAVAAAWILLSDLAVQSLLDVEIEGRGDALKGLGFVAVVSVLLFLLVARQNRQILSLSQQLEHQVETDAHLFRAHPEAMFVYDPGSLAILEVNSSLVDDTGHSREALLTMAVGDLVPMEDRSVVDRVTRSLDAAGTPHVWAQRCDGAPDRWLEITSHAIALDGRDARLAVVRDVTAQVRAEEALRASERRLAAVLASMQEVAFSIDVVRGEIDYLNEVAAEVLGIPPSELLMSIEEFGELVVPEDRHEVRDALHDVMSKGWAERQIRVVGRDGEVRTLRVRGTGVADADGRIIRVDGVAVDLTRREELERLVAHQRSFDQLTGLTVRSALVAAVDALLLAGSDDDRPAVLAMFDLDRFANVNEAAGHSVGDRVLVAVAERMVSVIEPGMLAARVGGDEFAVFCPAGSTTPEDMGSRLRAAVEGLFQADGYEFFISLSVGLARAEPDSSAEDLLRDAHLAMSAAKARTSGIEVFEATHRTQVADRVRVEGDLRRAISQGRLVAVYQPEVDLVSGRIVGVEALVRWNDPVRGLVAAGEFIAEAERSNLIIDIGDVMLAEALGQAAAWHREMGADAPVVWVNLSRRELDDPGVTERVAVAIDAAGVPVDRVGIEVTETAFVADEAPAIARLGELAELGVGLALDDFGTGWSSLRSLKSFPLTIVKVDQSFVSNVATAVHDRKIVQAIIGMAHGMSMRTIAEGVESMAQLEVLASLGCDRGQGFLLGRPVRAEVVTDLLRAGGVPPAMRERRHMRVVK